MVTWLAGNRIRGTTAERPALGLPSGSVGGWVEVGRTTLGSAGDTISVGSLADKRYYMILCDIQQVTSNIRSATRLNADTGSNYATRDSENGGADSTATSGSYIKNSGSLTTPMFNVQYLSNLSTKEKLMLSHNVGQQTAGASNAPSRMEAVGKWANTSNAISTIAQYNDQGGSYNTNSEVVVLGWDPADTHTSNFWEELATASGTGSTLDTGTFAAKKYLWVQGYSNPTSSSNIRLNFNSDTAGNYAIRESINGGTDTTNIEQASSDNLTGTATGGLYFNLFMINNAGQEKLWISIGQENTAGAGTAGDRKEMVGKWVNTVDSITKIVATSNFGTGSIMKVWGSD